MLIRGWGRGLARLLTPGCRRVTHVPTRGWRSGVVPLPIRGWGSGLVPMLIRGWGREAVR